MSLLKKMIFGNENRKLPTTRFKQFFFIIKENFLLLFYCGIISFAFLAPTLYIVMSSYSRYYQMITNSSSIDASKILELLISTGSILILTITLIGIGYAGMYNIVIKLIFNEGATIKDYFLGIKKNIIKFIIIYFIEGLLIFFTILNYASYYYINEINKYIKLFALIISFIFLLIYMLIKPVLIVLLAIFKNKFSNVLKNSFILMISKLFTSIFLLILTNILYFLLLIFIGTPLIIDMILIILFQFAYSTLTNSLFVINTYENLINKETYKSIYHKGLEDYIENE